MTSNLNFYTRLEALLEKSGADLYFVQVENLPALTLAYGHSQANALVDMLAKKIDGYRIMSDQIVISEPAKNDAKKTVKHFKDVINELEVHIAVTVNHRQFAPGQMNARAALGEVYSDSLRGNVIFLSETSASPKTREAESLKQMEVAKQIKAALAQHKFQLAFQPIIEAKSGEISHYEALLRLEENGELKSAGSLIMVAEKMGLIDAIDLYVLELVVKKLKANPDIRIALNISNLTIGNREWIKCFFDSITPQIGQRMVIEITETTAFRDLPETAYFIATLQDTGCMFALDDFGSGYTSFRQIRALSFDYIKIDGSLVSDIATNQQNRILVKSLLEYLQSMNIKTIAEYVENGEIAKLLMDFGVDYMQGNYFGKAEMPRSA